MRPLFRLLILVFVFPMMLACAAGTLNLREGINYFKLEDYRKAFIRLKSEADKGQPDAQYAVGYMYYYGKGVVEDRKKAWFWINSAAEKGQADAKTALKILNENS